MEVKTNEIFYGIQGEGVYQGIPTVFVRFQGCSLITKCQYCDTAYAQDGKGGTEMTVEEVVSEVSRLSPFYNSWVCITGGEPLWQLDALEELVRQLKKGGYKIEIETNGSLPIPRWYTLVDSWNADIKCPCSGVCGVSREEWFRARAQDQIKFVVGTEEDLKFTKEVLSRHVASSPVILVSPMIKPIPYWGNQERMEWLQRVVEFCKKERVRFSLQWHKVVFGDKKGV